MKSLEASAESLSNLPPWAWVCIIVAGIVLEMVLGRSKDPRWRSVGDAVRNLLGIVLSVAPGGGVLLRALQAIYVVPRDHQPRPSRPKKPLLPQR